MSDPRIEISRDFSIRLYLAILLTLLQARRAVGILRNPANATHLPAIDPQSGITGHYASFAVAPSANLTAIEPAIDVYGFTHIPPSASMNAIARGVLPYESRNWTVSVSMISPEADSPWSERDSPPPPYVLSPGTYHLRLEAATRPSPPSR